MKLRSFLILVMIGAFSLSFNFPVAKLNNTTLDCDSIPVLNKQIIAYVKTTIKKKVGRGECWDLAYELLKLVDAKWDGKYRFGEEVKVNKDCIYPGDIIQFEGVVVKYTKDGVEFKEKLAHHTAVIYEIKGKGDFILAHQNTAFSGKKVGLSPLNIADISKGKYKIYRPVK